ncbi:very-long-chain 3-oxoacyl-CoA reductase 1 [Phalaenopsis equestris]|uniref:very-long-chain 3-oxoacyl-CoA reductase 1 n=1 Tax=Phalaenopsis equestris TaxID=78828 RepID=UPI0009E21A4F|nr:very-long-chain 3-oxoacyl-CoA reductase 1 [Phalaenopsis equestris]
MELSVCLASIKEHPAWILALSFLGLLSLIKVSVATLRWVFFSFIRPGKNLKRYGSWAIVTGATDGIGRALAFQLVRRGLGVVLVGRSPDKLVNVSAAIRDKHPNARVETVQIDFAGGLVEGVARLRKAIEGMDVGILVNNAGMSYPFAKYLHEVEENLIKDLIKVNVEGLTRVTHAVLPGMVERKRGAVLNIGSGASTVLPSDPLYAIYAASKAYADQFSKCLYVEVKDKGIDVQCQVPLYVATKMASIRRSSFFVPSADTYAQSALQWIGYEPRCTPYWPHSLLWTLVSILPVGVVDKWRLGFCLNIRKGRLLKELAKKHQ